MVSFLLRSLIGLAIILVMVNIVRANLKSYEESHIDKGKRFAKKVEQLYSPKDTAATDAASKAAH